MTTCWLCPNTLEGENRTGEHVIPSAIGGHKEVFGFICRSCNSKRGTLWEAEIAKQFLWFSTAAAVKRGRGGEHPDLKVKTVSGKKMKLRADTVLVPDTPEVDIEELQERIDVKIRTSDLKTAINLSKMVAGKYPDFDFEKAVRERVIEDSYLDEPLEMSFQYGGPKAGRSMVKSCLALISETEVKPDSCGKALSYLNDRAEDPPYPYCFYFKNDLIVDRPVNHLFHCLSVIGQPQHRRILGYVEYFNFARILIHIGDNYEGEPFQATYAIDPVEARELDLTVDFGRLQESLDDLFVRPKEPPQKLLEALEHAGNIVNTINRARVLKLVMSKASAHAMSELGESLDGQDFTLEKKEEWLKHYLRVLRPYIESVLLKNHT